MKISSQRMSLSTHKWFKMHKNPKKIDETVKNKWYFGALAGAVFTQPGRCVPNIFFQRFLWNATDFEDKIFCNRLTFIAAYFGDKTFENGPAN